MNDIEKMVIATAMRKMFEKGWVDICAIDQCLRVAGVIPPKRARELLSTLHCVNFGDMPRELVDRLPGLLTECFNGLKIDDLMRACEPAQRLLNQDRKRLQ